MVPLPLSKEKQMVIEYIENVIELLVNLIALLFCLFYYISSKRKGWIFAILFFLSSLLSSYYWTSYLIIMGDWPNVSAELTYFGWNVAFFVLIVLLLQMKSPEERRYFHPLMLLPIPLNIWQLILYLPYSPLFNNIYQVTLCTLMACFGIQGFCWYRKKRKEGAAKPYVSLAVFLFSVFEFGMWSFSCMDQPWNDLYYPFSFLASLNHLLIVWAVWKTYNTSGKTPPATFDRKYQIILKAASAGIVLIFSLGGIWLGIWMRNIMTLHLDQSAGEVYDIIPIVLFVISLILIAFIIAIIFVVYFAQRTAENNKLREARRIAERSSAAKSEFLANMSHEIRTPINAIMGMNEVILRESRQACDRLPGSSDDVHGIFADICGYAKIIDSAGKNLLSIINDILDISRIEAGKLEIREDPYILSSVLSDVCNLAGFRAKSKNLAFHVNVDSGLPDHLYGDALRIRQIMLNILNNAVKYTSSGSVTLTVSTDAKSVPEAGQTINMVFSVKDTGIGIRPEDLDKLFDKFVRAGSSDNSGVEGTGLGLAISRNLLDMMGGTIRVESVFGEGSVFTVSIPQKIISREAIGNFLKKPEADTESADIPQEFFRAPEARILIVDDTRMNLTVTAELLKNTGIRIDTATDGDEALRYTLSVPYDLILMDQRMPGMDGTEALRLIRAQDGGLNCQTPVICLTADAISGAKERYLAEGFSDYISKPIDSRLLRKKIISFLPPEKVILLPYGKEDGDPNRSVASPALAEAFSTLRAEGINVIQGLRYCQQDESLYRSVLSDFSADAPENMRLLEQYFISGAWKDYSIMVHTLKSVSGTIGASRLSEAAADMEAASKNGDIPAIRDGHPHLLSLYRRTADAVRSFGAEQFSPVAENDGVMEFAPE